MPGLKAGLMWAGASRIQSNGARTGLSFFYGLRRREHESAVFYWLVGNQSLMKANITMTPVCTVDWRDLFDTQGLGLDRAVDVTNFLPYGMLVYKRLDYNVHLEDRYPKGRKGPRT